jgi:hypothetical protein
MPVNTDPKNPRLSSIPAGRPGVGRNGRHVDFAVGPQVKNRVALSLGESMPVECLQKLIESIPLERGGLGG